MSNRSLLPLLLLLSALAGCATPVQVMRHTGVLVQVDVSPPKAPKPGKVPRELLVTWQALLADMEADAATQHLLQELFSGLPIELRVAEDTRPETLAAPPAKEGQLVLRVAEGGSPLVLPMGSDWFRCRLEVDMARVGDLSRETPRTRSELVYDGAIGALRLCVEAYMRRKLKDWSFGATPRRTTIGQRVEVYKQRNAWRRSD